MKINCKCRDSILTQLGQLTFLLTLASAVTTTETELEAKNASQVATTLAPEEVTTDDLKEWTNIHIIIIAVVFVAILTICIILLIVRSMKHRRTDSITVKRKRPATMETINQDYSHPNGNYRELDDKIKPNNSAMVGRRKEPIRQVDKKWYDSTLIPFIDDQELSSRDCLAYPDLQPIHETTNPV